MAKIPTLFERDERFHVVDRPRAECAWVFDGAGVGTEKLDGTNIRLTVRSGQLVRVEKRRNPNKAQKQQGIVDGWYVDTDAGSAEDKWILAAAGNTDVSGWPNGEHPCEALGPRIQGNPLALAEHLCIPFDFQAPGQDQAQGLPARHGRGLNTRVGNGSRAVGVRSSAEVTEHPYG
ncbi:hypothetical protein [Crossiella sp. NPDC003009]